MGDGAVFQIVGQDRESVRLRKEFKPGYYQSPTSLSLVGYTPGSTLPPLRGFFMIVEQKFLSRTLSRSWRAYCQDRS